MQRHSIKLGAFMTSILAANLFLKTRWRRFALVAFAIPLAILRNGFRILVIGLLCVNIRPADDSQPDSPARWSPLFRAFTDPIFSSVVVAAQG